MRIRNLILVSVISLLPLNALAESKSQSVFEEQIQNLEKNKGGRIGVAALNTANNQRLQYKGDERFALCSTFKLLMAAAVLSRVDSGDETLTRSISFDESDMQEYAPIAQKYLTEGKMTISDLSAAIIQYSDNTAANLLFKTLGGPQGLTDYIRTLGDNITRIDRIEPDLNTNISDDLRDTTTPVAMLDTMQKLLIGDALSSSSKEQLIMWLVGNTTGDARIRAGMLPSWKVGDKTGTGENGASNDVAIVWPANGKPFLLTVYYSGATISADARNAVIAEVARIVRESFGAE